MQTFDGERCLYAALNDPVRQLLLDEGFERAGALRRIENIAAGSLDLICHCADAAARGHDPYMEFLEKLFDNHDSFPDAVCRLSSGQLHLHRFILAARSPLLCTYLLTYLPAFGLCTWSEAYGVQGKWSTRPAS